MGSKRTFRTVPAGFDNAEEREALGRLTSASPYRSIKVSDTSLDHLLLGMAADWEIIRLCFAAWQICFREPNRLAGYWGHIPIRLLRTYQFTISGYQHIRLSCQSEILRFDVSEPLIRNG
jgi:hypothetical protein